MAKVLFIIGSLREKSFNRQLSCVAQEALGSRADVTWLEYADIPYMNQDIEFPTPESIDRVRSEVQHADAIWIFTAEYNYNIPGVLKNLLDWLSRPLKANDWSSGSAAAGKVVTIAGAGGRNATGGARASLAKLLVAMRMTLVGDEGTGVALDGEAFATDVATFTDETRAAIEGQANELLAALE